MDLTKVWRKDLVDHFQALFDATRVTYFQRLPRLLVDKVVEVAHEQTRAEYLLLRAQLVGSMHTLPTRVPVRSQAVDWATALGRETCEAAYNEFYLFHGTKPSVAEKITSTDFLIKPVVDHGCTFGQGVYLAESVTHAQFFASQVCSGLHTLKGACVILVCRALCGRIQDAGQWHATARTHPDAATFEANVAKGTFHSTMGAEWPSNPELREFVLPDDDQVLPEFMVFCHNEA